MTAILKHSVDDVYSAATLALSEGLSVFPPAQDGTKRPDGPWMHYQTEAPTTDELDQWYEGTGRTGVGVVCGAVSGGLEMLEFEGRAIGVIPEFKELCTAAGLFELFHRIATGYYETTPSGGVHLLYRCEEVDGNTALARNEDGEILIETRGEGGFCITAPIFGAVHPSGEPWTLRRGGFSTIVTISGTERHELHRLCRSLDRYQRERSVIGAIDQAAVTNGLRPDDDYNQRATWPEILEPLRWVPLYTARDGNQHWRRPGKELGTSVTVSDNGAGVFYCFSSSAAPFEPDTPYSKFGAVTVLEHGGDFKAAARALAKQGYGDVLTMPADNSETMGALSDGWLNTESGNSSRLIRLAGDELRYVHKWGRFLVYKQGRWVIDEKDAIVGEVAKGVARKIMGGLKDLASSEQRDREFKWAKHSEGGAAIGHMVRLSRGVPGVLVQHEELDADPHLLNVRNGTIDLYTGELRIHDPAHLMTLQCPIAYYPDARAPLWQACLERWQPDPEIRRYLQVRAGACATGQATETIDVDYGTGGNGKSKFHLAIQNVLGPYAVVPHKSLLVAQKHEQHDTVKAQLFRKRLAVAGETKSHDSLDEEQVKSITGGDRLTARRMREDPWEFDPSHTLILFSNYRPRITGTDEAIWRRVRLVPWTVTIPELERDEELPAKLRAEAPGILAWIVEGAGMFLANGLTVPDSVRAATAQYRSDEDLVGRFVAQMLLIGAGETPTATIKQAFEEWCSEQGIAKPPRMNDVATALERAGCKNLGRRRVDGRTLTLWGGVTMPGGQPVDQGELAGVTPSPPSSVYPSGK